MIAMMLKHEIDQVYLAIRRLEVAVNRKPVENWQEIDKLAQRVEDSATILREEIKK